MSSQLINKCLTTFLYRESHINSLLHRHVFLSQACAGHRPANAWFLKIDPVQIVGMRVCVCVCVGVCGCVRVHVRVCGGHDFS